MKEVMYPRRSGRRTQMRVTPISEKPTVRVAIYTRISTNEENQPYSLEAQRKHLEHFVESQPKWLQTHFFTDQITGTTSKRPGLQAALLAAKMANSMSYSSTELIESLEGAKSFMKSLRP